MLLIVVADSEKFNKRAPVSLKHSGKIDVLYTDIAPPENISHMLEENDIEVVVP